MAGAVETVRVRPFADGFFAVGPDEPDAVAVTLFARRDAQLIGEFEEDRGGRAAVVSAKVSDIAQRVVGVVVAEDDDDAVFSAGKFGNDVAYGKLPFHGVGGEGVVFDFLMIFVAHVAWAESSDFASVLEGPLRVDMRKRGVVGLGCGACCGPCRGR